MLAPLPISSSGVNPIHILPWGIFSFIILSHAVIISAIPALSSAPKRVVPSVVIKVLPFKFFKCGNFSTERTVPFKSVKSSPL